MKTAANSLTTFTNLKSAIAYINNNERKCPPCLVRLADGKTIVACSNHTRYKLMKTKGVKHIWLSSR